MSNVTPLFIAERYQEALSTFSSLIQQLQNLIIYTDISTEAGLEQAQNLLNKCSTLQRMQHMVEMSAPSQEEEQTNATQPLQGPIDQNIEEHAVNRIGDKLTLRIEDNSVEDIHSYRVIWHNDGYRSMRYHCDTAIEARKLFEALQIVIAYDEL